MMTLNRNSMSRVPLPGCRIVYPRGIEKGRMASAKLEIPSGFLDRGYRLWVRAETSKLFSEVTTRTSPLEFAWDRALHQIDLRCSCPHPGACFSGHVLLQWEPSSDQQGRHLHLAPSDNAVVSISDLNLEDQPSQEFWIVKEFRGEDLDWRNLDLPSARWKLDYDKPYALLKLNSQGRREKHVAVAVAQQLTVGRLHLGDDWKSNQSPRGSHWHLGWQRRVADPNGGSKPEDVPEPLRRKARDWMSRRAVSLEIDGENEEIELKARLRESKNAGLPGEFVLRKEAPLTWILTLKWNEYADSLEMHTKEARIAGVLVPWFWAERVNVEQDLEDRHLLWLPWSWKLLELAETVEGWLGTGIRWFLDRNIMEFVDESFITEA